MGTDFGVELTKRDGGDHKDAGIQRASTPTVEWQASGSVDEACPVCRTRGAKSKVVALIFPFSSPTERVQYLACDGCGCLFHARPVKFAYEVETGYSDSHLNFYLEQGASIDGMARFLYIVPPGENRYLEVGTGFGFSLHYAQQVLCYECVGLDPSPMARAGADLLGVDIRPIYFTSPDDVPGKFDLIGCSEVIEHITDPVRFVRSLVATLSDKGAVWFTTPNAAVVGKEMAASRLRSIIGVGHPILYTAASLQLLLAAAGFEYVDVWEEGASLCGVASVKRRAFTKSALFDRVAYRNYLRSCWDKFDKSTPLGSGFGVRLFKELVNSGDYESALDVLPGIEQSLSIRFGIDLADPLKLPLANSIEGFGKHLPYNVTGLLFHKGILALNHLQDVALAEKCFTAAFRVGSVALENMERAGWADHETLNLTEESLKHLVLCLQRCDTKAALARIEYVRSLRPPAEVNVGAVIDIALLERAGARVVELTMAGRYQSVESLLDEFGPDLHRSYVESSVLPAKLRGDFLFATGIYAMNHLSAFVEAAELFQLAFDVARTESNPANDQLAWNSLFHRGLAQKMAGELDAAKEVVRAFQMRRPRLGGPFSPPDEALASRIAELS